RLDGLYQEFDKPKKVNARIEYLDPHTRETAADETSPVLSAANGATALAVVVRGFENPNVPHVFDSIDPAKELARFIGNIIERDLWVCERRLERIDLMYAKAKSDELARERTVVAKCIEHLNDGELLERVELRPEESEAIKAIEFYTAKPLLAILNADECKAATERLKELSDDLKSSMPSHITVVSVCARIEQELLELEEDDRCTFMDDMCITSLAQDRIIRASYEATGTICFFTVGNDEVRAWPLRAGTKSVGAAGTIHSDLARGFIRAEVLGFDDYLKAGSVREAKAQKMVRLEGKEYTVQDGDIIEFRFNV
ncbi:MAG: redox-regulated ATPase YchF, partial [Candidatus Coatesbacteria bacterium]|nr:redox-regulated ATPase YchF [Candidatus Coatesbacteria bacterium]